MLWMSRRFSSTSRSVCSLARSRSRVRSSTRAQRKAILSSLLAERPTFHEIISLGDHLRRKAGWPIPAIQQLRGHTTEKMTRHYLEGHEWVQNKDPHTRKTD